MSTLPLDPGLYRDAVRRALADDLGWGDLTSSLVVPDGAKAAGLIVARARLVLAGLDVAPEAFRQLDPSIEADIRRRAIEQTLRAAGPLFLPFTRDPRLSL